MRDNVRDNVRDEGTGNGRGKDPSSSSSPAATNKDPGLLYHVEIPAGLSEGAEFDALTDGVRYTITVPAGFRAGDVLTYRRDPAEEARLMSGARGGAGGERANSRGRGGAPPHAGDPTLPREARNSPGRPETSTHDVDAGPASAHGSYTCVVPAGKAPGDTFPVNIGSGADAREFEVTVPAGCRGGDRVPLRIPLRHLSAAEAEAARARNRADEAARKRIEALRAAAADADAEVASLVGAGKIGNDNSRTGFTTPSGGRSRAASPANGEVVLPSSREFSPFGGRAGAWKEPRSEARDARALERRATTNAARATTPGGAPPTARVARGGGSRARLRRAPSTPAREGPRRGRAPTPAPPYPRGRSRPFRPRGGPGALGAGGG